MGTANHHSCQDVDTEACMVPRAHQQGGLAGGRSQLPEAQGFRLLLLFAPQVPDMRQWGQLHRTWIGGAVWGERVQYEPLTDVVNLLPLWQQERVALRLARQMQALCICAKDLPAECSVQAPSVSTQRSLLYANGIPSVLHDTKSVLALHNGCICLPWTYVSCIPTSS